jgi:hypothetical protein
MKNFERELPDGYREVYRIDALDKKTGLVMNIAALLISAVTILLLLIPFFTGAMAVAEDLFTVVLIAFGSYLGIFAYIILHELVHGAAYKLLTGEKLTFGFSWSCAFCGVPHIYVNRRIAFISLVSPLIAFTVLFGALITLFAFISAELYLVVSIIFCMHLGGCVGDMYVTGLLLFKLRHKDILMRDTGPMQTFYIPEA